MHQFDDVVDLLVVGGGTAGMVGARTAARLGAKVLLVERARTGGDCLWTGCVPSKTLLSAAAAYTGQAAADLESFTAVRRRIAAAITAIEPDDSPETLRAAGVGVRHGSLRFVAPGRAELDGVPVRFRQALVATGSEPRIPDLPGLEKARVVTSESIWELTELPGHLVIIGGGTVACELGQAYARLGSEVTMLAGTGILPKEDREAAGIIRDSLQRDGVRILDGVEAQAVEAATDTGTPGSGASIVRASDGGSYPADVVLVAIGATPRTMDLCLDTLGVDLDEDSQIVVDAMMRTSAPTIWAAGDVTQHPDLTHVAGAYASTAASNAVLGVRRAAGTVVPRVTYTSPEVAAVGLTGVGGQGLRESTVHHLHADRAITEGHEEGFTRLIIGKGGRILGGTIVGPRAGESLAELTLAVQQKLSTRDIAAVIHPYPTYNDSLWNAALADAGKALDGRVVSGALSVLLRLTRRRVDRRGQGAAT